MCTWKVYFAVGHPSLNFWASEKEVATCWYEYPIKPWAGMLHPAFPFIAQGGDTGYMRKEERIKEEKKKEKNRE